MAVAGKRDSSSGNYAVCASQCAQHESASSDASLYNQVGALSTNGSNLW